MAKSYKGVNLNGDALMHYRTKGSRNGYSKNPNYRAVGQRATGRLINGRYVYDNPAAQKGAKNNWQQQANATAGMSMANKINRAKIEALSKKGAKNNWQQAGNLTRSMTEVARDLRNRYDLEQKAKAAAKEQTVSGAPTRFGSNAVSAGPTGVSAGKIGYFDRKKAAKQTKKLVKKAPNNPEMNNPYSANYKSFSDQIEDIKREQWNKKFPMATNQTQGSKVLYDKPTGFISKAIMENSKKGITSKNPNMLPFQSKTNLTPEQISKTLSVGKFLQQHSNKGETAARLHKLKEATTPKMTSAMANDPRYTQQAKNPNGRPRARQKVVSTGGKGVQIREKSANSGMGNDPRYTKVDPAYRKAEIAKKSESGAKNDWQAQAALASSGARLNQQRAEGKIGGWTGGALALSEGQRKSVQKQVKKEQKAVKKQEKAAKKQQIINKIKNIFSKKKK